jgi:hypothetical protein
MKLTDRLSEIRKNYIQYLPFTITGLMTMISMTLVWIEPEFINENGDVAHYIVTDSVKFFGFGIIFNFILILFHKDIWKYTFSIQLLLAFFGVIDIISSTYKIGIGFVEIEIISSALFLIHIIANNEIINHIIREKEIDPEKAKELKQNEMKTMIEFYVKKFEDKSRLELEEILNSGSYTNEAEQAAKRLLNK